MRFSLAESHVLNIGNSEFYLIIALLFNLLQPSLGSLVIHLGYTYEGKVVIGFGTARGIIF